VMFGDVDLAFHCRLREHEWPGKWNGAFSLTNPRTSTLCTQIISNKAVNVSLPGEEH
jgi:hypothetical protein